MFANPFCQSCLLPPTRNVPHRRRGDRYRSSSRSSNRASHLAGYLQTKKINIVYRLIRDNIQRETAEIKNGDIIFVKSRFFGQVSRLDFDLENLIIGESIAIYRSRAVSNYRE